YRDGGEYREGKGGGSGYSGRGGGEGYRGGSNYGARGGNRGRGEYRGGFGGGERYVTSGLQSMNLGAEPEPLDFAPPKNGEQDGYKAAAKPAPAFREGKKTFDVFFNAWEFEFNDRLVYSYDVCVSLEAVGNDNSTRVISVNKGPRDDASVHERNELIKAAIKAGLEIYRILSETGVHLSDGASLMYTNEDIGATLKGHHNKISVPVSDLLSRYPQVRKFIRNSSVRNIVIEVNGCKRFNMKDFSGMTNVDRKDVDQSVKQFFEILTSDHALSTHTYHSFTGGKLYRARPDGRNTFPDAGFGQERRPGMSKGFTLAEKDGGIIAALNIDSTTGTFWCGKTLVDTIMKINGWQNVMDAVWTARAILRTNNMLKGLRVSYLPPNAKSSFDFQISSLTASCSTTTKGDTYCKVTTIEDKTVKNSNGEDEPLYNKFSYVDLKLRHWPLIESKRTKRRVDDPTQFDVITQYFPVELLTVKDHQRVHIKKQGEQVHAIRVNERWNRTSTDLEALNLCGHTVGPVTNPILEAFGVRVVRKPLSSKAIVRNMPTITFKQPGFSSPINTQHSTRTRLPARLPPISPLSSSHSLPLNPKTSWENSVGFSFLQRKERT
ncbi:hypothetical protein PMAYCL1PPCAC_24524, partial [Pristionchus mayeri]